MVITTVRFRVGGSVFTTVRVCVGGMVITSTFMSGLEGHYHCLCTGGLEGYRYCTCCVWVGLVVGNTDVGFM